MYESFYKLQGKPFRLTPDFRFFFESQGHKRAIAYLRYGLEQREGFIVITGGIGTGKSTLVDMLFQLISRQQIVAAKVVTTQLEADDLLRMVCASFGLPHEQMSKTALLKSLETFFQRKASRNERVLLVIDEAQNIPKSSLEELRMLSNIQVNGVAVLQTFLLGQEEFMEILQAPDMEQLRQRVIATYRLKPLSPEETPGYIEHRLRLVGWAGDPSFDQEAYAEIHAQTGGVPRRLNTFCDRLMLFGYLEEIHAFTAAHVRAVASELHGEMDRPQRGEVSAGPAVGSGGDGSWRNDMLGRLTALEERMDELEDALVLERARSRG
jgi:putative secretion ATPase (PEP-CTERM system associated)